jgi:hypothetical protein
VRLCHHDFPLIRAVGRRIDALQCIATAFLANAFPSISCIARSRARCRQGRAASAVAWEVVCSHSVPARAG